jgi:hypothetical protein
VLSGFSKASRNNVTLSVGATVGINFALSPGAVTETVQVTGSPPDIQTEKADISSVVDEETLKSLPLISRNVLGLITLQPGITGVPSDTGNDIFVAEQGLGLNASGTRESANNAMVDGVTISNNAWGGTVLLVPNAEAVQEFEVIANTPRLSSGAIVVRP